MNTFTYAPDVVWNEQVEKYLRCVFGDAAFERTAAALCTPPLHTCLRVNTVKCSPQDILEQILQHPHKPQQAAACSENNGGSTHQQPRHHLLPYVHPQVPSAVIIPGSGPFKPDYSRCGGKEVLISRLAGEAVLRGAELYCPGVIACSGHVVPGDAVAVSIALERPGSHTCGIPRGTTLTAQDTVSSGRSNLYIGIGRAAMSRSQIFRETHGVAVHMEQRVFEVSFDADRFKGVAIMQNLPSIVAAQVLGVTPGMRVLDMCAAPGGKTTMLAQLMGDQGCIIALDRTQAKVVEIRSLAKELGLSCIYSFKMDSTKAVARQQDTSQPGCSSKKAQKRTLAAITTDTIPTQPQAHQGTGTLDPVLPSSSSECRATNLTSDISQTQATQASRELDPVLPSSRSKCRAINSTSNRTQPQAQQTTGKLDPAVCISSNKCGVLNPASEMTQSQGQPGTRDENPVASNSNSGCRGLDPASRPGQNGLNFGNSQEAGGGAITAACDASKPEAVSGVKTQAFSAGVLVAETGGAVVTAADSNRASGMEQPARVQAQLSTTSQLSHGIPGASHVPEQMPVQACHMFGAASAPPGRGPQEPAGADTSNPIGWEQHAGAQVSTTAQLSHGMPRTITSHAPEQMPVQACTGPAPPLEGLQEPVKADASNTIGLEQHAGAQAPLLVPQDADRFMVFEREGLNVGTLSQQGNEKVQRRLLRKQEVARRHAANCKTSAPVPQLDVKAPVPQEPKLLGFLPESFDAIMLDAPCTALGLRPRLLQSSTFSLLQQTAQYQRKLLDAAVQLLKPGGCMVYSTCSINPGENEANVRYVLDTYPFMRLTTQTPHIGGPGLTSFAQLPVMGAGGGGVEWANQKWLEPGEAGLVQRFDPTSDPDTIGFFVSRFQKTASMASVDTSNL